MFCSSLVGIEMFGASIFYGMLVALHIFVAFLLIVVILMQAAKGGGLSGAFGTGAGTSPLFGAATSSVLVRTTTVLAVLFAITCMSIAGIQSKRASIMRKEKQAEKEATAEPKEEEGAGEAGKKEEALSPVEATPETKEAAALSPVEAESVEKERKPVPTRPEESMSPVEGKSAGKEPGPPLEERLSPVGGQSTEKERGPAPAQPEKNLSPVEGNGGAE